MTLPPDPALFEPAPRLQVACVSWRLGTILAARARLPLAEWELEKVRARLVDPGLAALLEHLEMGGRVEFTIREGW